MAGEGNTEVLTKDFVPQELHDRAYIKPWLDKPWSKELSAEVFKKLDGAESLLGKRPQIPARDAKDEELDKFFSGYRPDKADDYEIPLTEGRPKPDEGFVKAMREAFYEGKLSKVQAGKLLAKIQEYGVAQEKVRADASAKKQAEFDTLAKAYLGEQNKGTMELVKKTLGENLPQAARGQLEKLSDEHLLIVAAAVHGIIKKYVPADDLSGKGSGKGASGAGGTVADKKEKARALVGEILKMKPMDPNIEKKQAEVNALYEEIAKDGGA